MEMARSKGDVGDRNSEGSQGQKTLVLGVPCRARRTEMGGFAKDEEGQRNADTTSR